jgi:tyrosyl-tRNA synthetase
VVLGAAPGGPPGGRGAPGRRGAGAPRGAHGDEGLEAAERATAVLFGDEPFVGLDDATLRDAFAAAPSVELSRSRLDQGLGLLEVATETGVASSRGEARRLVEQGGLYLNNERVDDATRVLTSEDLAGESILVLRAGKKRYALARFV